MTTLTAMLTEIQADTERTTASDVTAMRNKINAAIRHYQPKRLYFNESRSVTFNTVASTDTYAIGSAGAITTEFYRIDGVFITIAAGDVRELDRKSYTELELLLGNDTGTGEPSDYAFINNAIRLWKSPDAIYETRLTGHIKVAAPASDAEANNPWMVEAYDLIMCRAKAELYAHRWEDPGNAALMVEAERDALRPLEATTLDRTETGYLAATEF